MRKLEQKEQEQKQENKNIEGENKISPSPTLNNYEKIILDLEEWLTEQKAQISKSTVSKALSIIKKTNGVK